MNAGDDQGTIYLTSFLNRLRSLDDRFATGLIERYRESTICSEAGAYLSALVNLGSILEGVLYVLLKSGQAEFIRGDQDENERQDRLRGLIDAAFKRAWITEHSRDLAHSLRKLRNCVHLNVHIEQQFHFNSFKLEANRNTLIGILSELEPHVEIQCRQRDFLLTLPNDLIGRKKEQAKLKTLLLSNSPDKAPYRIITVCGHPGIGKTAFVENTLRTLSPEVLPHYILSVDLSQTETSLGFESKEAYLIKQLRMKRKEEKTILVLHSCEHLVREIREPLLESIKSRPQLILIATSTMPLGFPKDIELPFPLSGLNCEGSPPRDIEATQLFVKQIKKFQPAYSPLDEESQKLALIGKDWGGNPLAISLLAPQLVTASKNNVFEFKIDNPEKNSGLERLESAFDKAFQALGVLQRQVLQALTVYVRETSVGDIKYILDIRDSIAFDECIEFLTHSSWVHISEDKVSLVNGVRKYLKIATDEDTYLTFRKSQLQRFLTILTKDSSEGEHLFIIEENLEANILSCIEFFVHKKEVPDEAFGLIASLGKYWSKLGFADLGMAICTEACQPFSEMRSPSQQQALKVLGIIARQAGRLDIASDVHTNLVATANDPLMQADALQHLSDDMFSQDNLVEAEKCSYKALFVTESQDESDELLRLRSRSLEQLANIRRRQSLTFEAIQLLNDAKDLFRKRTFQNEWVGAWLDLLEANLAHDIWKDSRHELFLGWFPLSRSAQVFHAHRDYIALAYVAERALQFSLTLEASRFIRDFYAIARGLREMTHSQAHQVDLHEYLTECLDRAEREHRAYPLLQEELPLAPRQLVDLLIEVCSEAEMNMASGLTIANTQ